MKNYLCILVAILFSSLSNLMFADIISITSNTSNNYSIQFQLPEYMLSDTLLYDEYNDEHSFSYIAINDFGLTDDVGYPCLPQLTFNLPISTTTAGFNVTISNAVYEEVSLLSPLMPVQEGMEENQETFKLTINQSYYNSAGDEYNFHYQLSEPFIVFSENGIAFTIFPFIYNPQQGKLKVLKSGVFNLIPKRRIAKRGTASDSQGEVYNSEVREEYLSGFFQPVAGNRQASLFKSSAVTTQLSKGRYLMITTQEFADTLQPFTEYKRNLGYEVNVIVTPYTRTITSVVKEHIKTQYNDMATRPDFVLLVGGHDYIPAAEGNASGEKLNDPITDLPYACLEGDDLIADVILGRFPVSTPKELGIILRKTTFMEMNMHRLEKKAKFVAGTDRNCDHLWIKQPCKTIKAYMEGEFAKGHKTVIKETFRPQNYNCELLSQPSSKQIGDAINENIRFFIYSGHGGLSKLDRKNYSEFNLKNTEFPFVFVFGCKTGNFAFKGSLSSSWLVSIRGGITYFGSSVNSMNNSDKNMEECIFGKAFTERKSIGGMINLGKERYKDRFWAQMNPPRTTRYMKSYNLLGDPSLQVNGCGRLLSVPVVYAQTTVLLKNPRKIPVTWSITGDFALSNMTDTSVVVIKTGDKDGVITASFKGLASVSEDIYSRNMELSRYMTRNDTCFYRIKYFPTNLPVTWSLSNTDFEITHAGADTVAVRSRGYGKYCYLKARFEIQEPLQIRVESPYPAINGSNTMGCNVAEYALNVAYHDCEYFKWTTSSNITIESGADASTVKVKAQASETAGWIILETKHAGKVHTARKNVDIKIPYDFSLSVESQWYEDGNRCVLVKANPKPYVTYDYFAYRWSILGGGVITPCADNPAVYHTTPEIIERVKDGGTSVYVNADDRITGIFKEINASMNSQIISIRTVATASGVSSLSTSSALLEVSTQAAEQDTVVTDKRYVLLKSNPSPGIMESELGGIPMVPADDPSYAVARFAVGAEVTIGCRFTTSCNGSFYDIITILPYSYRCGYNRSVRSIEVEREGEDGDSGNAKTYRVQLYNEYGLVKAMPFDSNSQSVSFSLENLPNGGYYVNIVDAEGNIVDSQYVPVY